VHLTVLVEPLIGPLELQTCADCLNTLGKDLEVLLGQISSKAVLIPKFNALHQFRVGLEQLINLYFGAEKAKAFQEYV
jgi:hypothetical protein